LTRNPFRKTAPVNIARVLAARAACFGGCLAVRTLFRTPEDIIMPSNKKGAPVRASRPARASSADAVRKSGSISPKHRGYRAEDSAAPEREPKKRWSADERAARGRSEQRPRGAAGGNSARVGRERVERAADGRPNWEPKKAYDGRPTRSAAPKRGDDRDERGNRPPRSYDDAAGPRRTQRHDERTARPAGARSDRPAKSWDRDARPARVHDGASARGFDRDSRPPRSFDRDSRPARSFDRDSRPARSFDRDSRPARSWDERRDTAPRVQHEDVVLERLTAQAVTAGEVDGIGFADLGLGANIVRVLTELGAETPFPIQAATIPDVLAGRDVLGRGRTGSGKTIAFGAPLVERLLAMSAGAAKGTRREFGRAPRALILAPTRELALQIDRTVQPIAQSVGLFTTQIYGGVPYARQLGALQRGVDIVIGTPGRVGDLAAQGKLDLSKTVITVLDEADHMCELGFAEPVQEILDRTAEGGQKLLFSATLDKGVADIVERYLVDPAVFEVEGEDQASSTIDHQVLLLDQRDKQQVLIELAAGPGK
jgi:hypothetical protein